MKKRLLALVLCSAMIVSTVTGCGTEASSSEAATSKASETPDAESSSSATSTTGTEETASNTEFSFFAPIWDPYKEDSEILDKWQENTGSTIDFNFVQEDSYDTQLSALVASQDLPDVIKKDDGNVEDLISQNLLLPITDYLEEYCPNFMSQLTDEDKAYLVNANDGEIYGIGLVVNNEAAYSTAIRSDWLKNLGLEEPKTWDDWVNVWQKFKDEDANGNGNTDDEIPLAVSYDTFYMLEAPFGINSNGYFSVVDGKYVYDPENANYETFLDAMRDLYSKGILYQEYITCDDDQLSTIGSNDTLGSMVTWAEQAKNYSNACREMGDDSALFSCVTPITGPNGDTSIQARTKLQQNTFFTVAAKDRLPQILTTFDYLFSEDGINLTNYGIEGETYEMKDGEPVVKAPYNTDFATARSYDLIPAIIPFCFEKESYMQYLLGGSTYDDLDECGKSFVDGLNINDDYYYQAPQTFNTDAWTNNQDLVEQQLALRDNYIMGKITKDEYNEQYKQLKANGLQDVIDQAAAAYQTVNADN